MVTQQHSPPEPFLNEGTLVFALVLAQPRATCQIHGLHSTMSEISTMTMAFVASACTARNAKETVLLHAATVQYSVLSIRSKSGQI